MALSQSELMRLLESLRQAEGVEAISVVCERILQELIEAEATDVIGAAPGEHTKTRTTWRNGHLERLRTTQAGDLDLKVPKVRSGSFFPSLLQRRGRIGGQSCASARHTPIDSTWMTLDPCEPSEVQLTAGASDSRIGEARVDITHGLRDLTAAAVLAVAVRRRRKVVGDSDFGPLPAFCLVCGGDRDLGFTLVGQRVDGGDNGLGTVRVD